MTQAFPFFQGLAQNLEQVRGRMGSEEQDQLNRIAHIYGGLYSALAKKYPNASKNELDQKVQAIMKNAAREGVARSRPSFSREAAVSPSYGAVRNVSGGKTKRKQKQRPRKESKRAVSPVAQEQRGEFLAPPPPASASYAPMPGRQRVSERQPSPLPLSPQLQEQGEFQVSGAQQQQQEAPSMFLPDPYEPEPARVLRPEDVGITPSFAATPEGFERYPPSSPLPPFSMPGSEAEENLGSLFSQYPPAPGENPLAWELPPPQE